MPGGAEAQNEDGTKGEPCPLWAGTCQAMPLPPPARSRLSFPPCSSVYALKPLVDSRDKQGHHTHAHAHLERAGRRVLLFLTPPPPPSAATRVAYGPHQLLGGGNGLLLPGGRNPACNASDMAPSDTRHPPSFFGQIQE